MFVWHCCFFIPSEPLYLIQSYFYPVFSFLVSLPHGLPLRKWITPHPFLPLPSPLPALHILS
uniref:Uncharacterized protein n=1 Tax=Picea glauca TaxID=3330 RepID=A0A101M2X2_PICGL|nr:hypothetical protein ABT39_MTgene3299 [Picea glauca]